MARRKATGMPLLEAEMVALAGRMREVKGEATGEPILRDMSLRLRDMRQRMDDMRGLEVERVRRLRTGKPGEWKPTAIDLALARVEAALWDAEHVVATERDNLRMPNG